jgi:hypothetical protein
MVIMSSTENLNAKVGEDDERPCGSAKCNGQKRKMTFGKEERAIYTYYFWYCTACMTKHEVARV